MGGNMTSVHPHRSAFFLFLVLTLINPSTYAADTQSIQIKGSDTMVNLGQSWAETFMESNPDVSIAVTGGGSGTGVAAILSGTCDIAQSSRDLSAEEKGKAEKQGAPIKETTVGFDGIAVIAHPDNPVTQLTTDQLADIFGGKVKNWKDVGGKDLPILILSRERNSGTHIFFLEHIVRRGNAKGPEEFASSALMMPSSQAIATETQGSEAAIGYVGLGYVSDQVKVIEIGKAAGGPFLKPTIADVHSGEYAIARPLFFLTRGEEKPHIKKFIEFVVSPEGQEIVEVLDFVPLER
jgi:phosphate transport system substrate-binding protein